ncbi:fimbrial protein [Serratia quinivorans]|uniref:fimbrial protein n=1 Tax=Serratia quinivorans TaxID=137545 RepID=UPI002E79D0DF|nr:fimbrial protein [Serratia quinivorans]
MSKLTRTTSLGHRTARAKWRQAVLWGGGIGLFAAIGIAHADSGTLTFNGTILPGTCDVALDKPTIAFGSVDPALIISGGQWASVGVTSFALILSGCTGVGAASLTPGVKVEGTLSTDPGVSGNQWLFKTGGTSKGFGVVVYNSTPAKPGVNEAGNGEIINIPQFGKGTTLPAAGTKIPLSAAVSGGRAAWFGTNKVNLKAGDLTAAVTFTFAYR